MSPRLVPGYSLSQGKVAFSVSNTARAWLNSAEVMGTQSFRGALPNFKTLQRALSLCSGPWLGRWPPVATCSWQQPIAAGHWLPAPSEDTGLTMALAQRIKTELSLARGSEAPGLDNQAATNESLPGLQMSGLGRVTLHRGSLSHGREERG